MDNKTLKRIAKALEELIALVKEDLKPKRAKKNQTQRPAAMVPGGPWHIAQGLSGELQEVF